jgi:hypothetical protein
MTSLANDQLPGAPADAARRFLDALAVQDFEELAANLSDDVRLRALLPGATKEWHGVDRVKTTFVRWFGDTQEFELVETAVDERGARVHVSWHARVRAERLGAGWFRVEQHGYAEADEHNRIEHLWLTCSGYLAEAPTG